MRLTLLSILLLACTLLLTTTDAQENKNKIRRVVRRRGRQRNNRQIGFGNRVQLAPTPLAPAPARFAPALVPAPLPLRFAPSPLRFAPTPVQARPAPRFAHTPLRFAPAPVQARPAPQPIQVFQVTPNNFGEFPSRNQFIQRQPVFPFAPAQHSVPVGHHFIPTPIAQARQQVAPTAAPIAAPTAAPTLVEVARSAPVAAPVAVPAPTPFAFPVAAPAPVSAPLPVARAVAAPVAITSYVYNAPGQNLNNLNTWDYGFEAENGIKQTASGSMKQVGEEEFVVMRGSYQYIGPDALTYTVNWEADENGFRADAPHLPQPVAIPFPEVAAAVEAQLRFAASQPAYVEPEN